MRITNASMVRSHLYDTQNNLTNMSKINQQISTGKVINTVSDDPHKAIKIMNINNEIKYTEKYNYNIDESVGWMNTTDGALDNVGNLLGEIKETILNENLKIVKDVRGLGLMLGIEVDGDSSIVQKKALENGLLVLTAGKNVVRLLPPLNISVEDVEAGLNILVKVLKEYK